MRPRWVYLDRGGFILVEKHWPNTFVAKMREKNRGRKDFFLTEREKKVESERREGNAVFVVFKPCKRQIAKSVQK